MQLGNFEPLAKYIGHNDIIIIAINRIYSGQRAPCPLPIIIII